MTRKRHHIPAEHFMAQFHNHDHYVEHGPDEHRPEWWQLPAPRKQGGRVDFARGGFAQQTNTLIDRALTAAKAVGRGR